MTERWLITGAAGQLGSHAVRHLSRDSAEPELLALVRRHDTGTQAVTQQHVDLADADALRSCVLAFRPTHVLHLGAMTAVGDCFREPELARRINTDATRVLGEVTADVNARLLFSSTDMVFAGDAAPYREDDLPRPLSTYGRTKHAAERALEGFDHVVIARLPLMYGYPFAARQNTFSKMMAAVRAGDPVRLFTDEYRTPVWLGDAAAAVIGLARSDVTGIIHLAGPERLSRYDLIARAVRLLGLKEPRLEPVSRLDIEAAEPRPEDLSLVGKRFIARFPNLAPGPVRPEAILRE